MEGSKGEVHGAVRAAEQSGAGVRVMVKPWPGGCHAESSGTARALDQTPPVSAPAMAPVPACQQVCASPVAPDLQPRGGGSHRCPGEQDQQQQRRRAALDQAWAAQQHPQGHGRREGDDESVAGVEGGIFAAARGAGKGSRE